jgi:hypothetical protein
MTTIDQETVAAVAWHMIVRTEGVTMPFVPLTPDEKRTYEPCSDPQHLPPSMLVIVEPMKWVCPACGVSCIIRPSPVRMARVPQTSKEPDSRVRTPHQIRAERGTVLGCCNRHADNLACDCMTDARAALAALEGTVPCTECGGSGYLIHPENGWNRNARRCSRGCSVRCAICRDPNCDNPGGQH